MVRQVFISSAVALVAEFHVDGFRVDQTTSMHSYAVLHGTGAPAEHANIFGAKFLREWTRTLRLLKPEVLLMAEDHSNWDAVTEPADEGGLGFDAVWYADFYHHLVGDGERGSEYARLVNTAGYGDDRPLAMGYFGGSLRGTSKRKVVYSESHDEAGNARLSGRTLTVAVNRAPLVGETRRCAEARGRTAVALAMLSAGTPMFFMGEEIGATEDYRYDDFVYHRDDFAAARSGAGRSLFRYYQDLIKLRRTCSALRSRQLEIVHVHDENRMLAFLRTDGSEDLLVLATLANTAWSSGYRIDHPALAESRWREIFNSDAAIYGGDNVGNLGAEIPSQNHQLSAVVASNAVVVFRRL
jgi:1,4-alpha-glucan branching enzyme